MLNAILIGLATIASILGYNKFSYYDFDYEDLNTIAAETSISLEKKHDTYWYFNSEIGSKDLYTIEGENRYKLFELDNGYIIYDKKDNSVDEFSSVECPYKSYEDYLLIYCEDSKYLKYGYVDDTSYYNILTKCYLDELIVKNTIDSDSEVGQWLTFTEYGSDVKKIENAFYFEHLNHRHGNNVNGTCGVVAIQILLGYYDTFYDDNIIPEEFDVITREWCNTIYDFNQSPGSNNNFHNSLISFASQNNITSDGIGMNISQEKNLTTKFLDSRNINYNCKWIEGNWADSTSNAAVKHIKEAIDANRPIFIGAAGHATVAYAYDSNYVYVHSGLGDIRRTPWETYDNNFWDFWGGTHTVDITSIDGHYHSDNYFSSSLNSYICTCGIQFSEQRISPSDYGFSEAYYYAPVEQNVAVGDLSFTTNRLRCGYIQNEVINLSPRKQNAGKAYLEYYFDNNVRKVIVNLSLWSSKERLYSSDSSMRIEYYNSATNSWVEYIDLLNDTVLSTDRENPSQIIINLPNNCRAFRFYSTSLAFGDRNKGRLSIEDITIIYS